MADKTITQLTPSASNLQDVDEMEVQKSGEAFTRKLTGTQVRAVEKAEREAQDDVIEGAVGLETDGTFIPTADSWFMRAADFAAGCTDRGGATGPIDENIKNALRLLDARVYTAVNGNYVILKANITDDDTWTDVVPAGYMLVYAIFEEKAGNTAVLDLGTSAGGNEVFLGNTITANELTTIVIQRTFSLTAATTLYLNDDDAGSGWNGATVDVYLVMQCIIPGAAAITGHTVVVEYLELSWAGCNLPTNADLELLIGLASDFSPGSIFVIKNINQPACSEALCMAITDGAKWYINSATFELAV